MPSVYTVTIDVKKEIAMHRENEVSESDLSDGSMFLKYFLRWTHEQFLIYKQTREGLLEYS